MKVDRKDGFLYVLGVIILALLYKIAYARIYGKEGFGIDIIGDILNPIKKAFDSGIVKPIEGGFNAVVKPIVDGVNFIIKGVTDILDFICYLKEVFIWLGNTVVCIFAVFNPFYCPVVRIIDMIIAFIGFIIGSLLRLIPYFGDIVIGAFNKAVNGIDDLTELLYGVRITDWHAMLGISEKCYWCKFKPFPKRKK